jgi:hypothetical protein
MLPWWDRTKTHRVPKAFAEKTAEETGLHDALHFTAMRLVTYD